MTGAIDFLKAYHEFCKAQDCVEGCPLSGGCLMDGFNFWGGHESEIVGIVMRWKRKQDKKKEGQTDGEA